MLLKAGTINGLQSLGWKGGKIAAGQPANLCALNLSHPALLGLDADNLMAGLSLHGDRTMVSNTWTQGKLVVVDGTHTHRLRSEEAYMRTLSTLFSG